MSPRQLIVLVIAAIAAVGALLLIRGMGRNSPEPEAETSAIVGEQVLVAARDINQGAALAPGDLAVATFPSDAVSPSFVRLSGQPSAQSDMVGAVTRRAFVRGEPIIASSVVQPEDRGFLAAQLEPGFRAVAVEVAPETAAGGYIQPNDHVDVIMVQKFEEGSREIVRSQIVLQDVRVIALGPHTETQSEGDGPEVVDADVAVLELMAEDARLLAQADRMGDIHLALRGVQVETVGMAGRTTSRSGLGDSGSVRIHAFGAVSGGGQ